MEQLKERKANLLRSKQERELRNSQDRSDKKISPIKYGISQPAGMKGFTPDDPGMRRFEDTSEAKDKSYALEKKHDELMN